MSKQSSGLSPDDLAREADRFGVSDEQVRRDHAISHVLAALSEYCAEDVVFFGGTALSRTHLQHARLSEDIDLLAMAPRRPLAEHIMRVVSRALLRTHGRISWNPGFRANEDVEPALMETPDGIAIKLQLLDGRPYSMWPTELSNLEQRYGDAPPARLRVPTLASFVGWKTDTWHARQAPRDLYDLWALADVGAIDARAATEFVKHGSTGRPPRPFMFSKAPTATEWELALAEQTKLTVSPTEALAVVRQAWASALGEDWSHTDA